MRVTIAVLGDLGRSPRIQYHALSLADAGSEVRLVGSEGSACPAAVEGHPRIRIERLAAPRYRGGAAPRRLGYAFRTALNLLQQSLQLLRALALGAERPDLILVQAPPALPTIAVALLAARLRSAKLVVDWHNFSYTVLALKLGSGSVAVSLLRHAERCFGRRADRHLCVSSAMQQVLEHDWGIGDACVFRDAPEDRFLSSTVQQRTALLQRLEAQTGAPLRAPCTLRAVCPTSWTDDEEMGLLLDAVGRWDRATRPLGAGGRDEGAPRLVVFITGRGPNRARWEAEIRRLSLRRSEIHTLWLEPDDYPTLLAAAHLGICLHRSSSGVDLPMKLADMSGAGLPVLAFDYGPCLAESFREGESGLVFRNAAELAEHLERLLDGFPARAWRLADLRIKAVGSRAECWSDSWERVVRPVLEAP